MENKKDVLKMNQIKSCISKYEEGDLLSLAEIFENINELLNNLPSNEKKIDDYIKKIRKMIDCFDRNENHKKFLTKLSEDIEILISFFSEQKNSTGDQQETIEEVPLIIEEKPMSYTPTYFESFINDTEMLAKFCDEAREHLDNSQYALLDLEYDSTNQENINKVFRCFHTLKSSSAFLGIKNIEDISHEVENILVLVRDGNISISSELIDVTFAGIGLVRDLIKIIEDNNFVPEKIIKEFLTINIFSYISLIKSILANYKTKKVGEILKDIGKIDAAMIQKILNKQKEEKKRFGEIAVSEKIITEEDLNDALKKQTVISKKASYVKVSNERLNSLIDMVGELVVIQSIIKDGIGSVETNSERSISQLETITTNIKNIVLSMGMVPISEIFNKLRVVIRNASHELGKIVDVEIFGEETELDRNVVEQIYDPFVHIVRNSVDHGIENPDAREAAGKNRVGKITIQARHRGSGIEISVTDDGHGIDKEKVIEKALKLGLISEEQKPLLTEKDIYNFMFLPGFSTAKEVTEMSGRGVGLDVVKKNIEQIHGKVEVSSEKFKATTFTIKLPLTLAIIDGFVTVVNNKKYIFPFNLIEEIIVPNIDNLSMMENHELMLFNRNKYTPVIFAGNFFNELEFNKDFSKIIIILINYEGSSYGVAVDSVIGKHEIVIKSLNEVLHKLKVFSGGTIFGDGSIGFVVDIEEFMDMAKKENLRRI
jgi:two-component system, chemotaxis family, sensor kinase CheA